MKSSVIHALLFAGMMAGLAGCQSAGRWAWWNRGQADDATAVAESSTAAPTLPSASATPHAITPAGLEPAASPSASNLAATGVAAGAMQVSVPSLAGPSTSASATAISTNSSIPGVPTIPGIGAAQQVASVPTTGPYDPNAYKPSTSPGATGTGTDGGALAVADRYGIASADRYSAPAASSPQATVNVPIVESIAPVAASPAMPDSRYPVVAAMPTTPSSVQPDRYGMPSVPAATSAGDRYSKVFAEPAPSDVANESPATAAAPSTGPIAQAISPAAQIETPTASATVQLKSPAGQYRPGGTSSYTIAPVQHVEVATRPGSPGSSQAPATTAPATTGIEGSVAPVPGAPATGIGVRY